MGDDGDGAITVRLALQLDAESDPDGGERLIRRLRTELAELDVESLSLVPGGVTPEGAKGADPVAMGAIVVALSASGGVFTSLIETVREWLGRQSGGHRVTVTIDGDTIELERATVRQRQALVDAFVRRHRRNARP